MLFFLTKTDFIWTYVRKRIRQKIFGNLINYSQKEFSPCFFLASLRENNTLHIKNNVIETSKTPAEGLFNDIEFKELNEPVEFDGCLILEEITSNLEKHLNEESDDTDATDGSLDVIAGLSKTVTAEFEDLLEGDNGKNLFLKSLSKIFALLLNAKVGTADKIKKSSE